MAAARPLVDDPAPEPRSRRDEADAAAFSELAALLLEGARRVTRERGQAAPADEPALTRKRRRERRRREQS